MRNWRAPPAANNELPQRRRGRRENRGNLVFREACRGALVLEATDELRFAEDVVFNGLLELGFGGVGLEIDYIIQRV